MASLSMPLGREECLCFEPNGLIPVKGPRMPLKMPAVASSAMAKFLAAAQPVIWRKVSLLEKG